MKRGLEIIVIQMTFDRLSERLSTRRARFGGHLSHFIYLMYLGLLMGKGDNVDMRVDGQYKRKAIASVL